MIDPIRKARVSAGDKVLEVKIREAFASQLSKNLRALKMVSVSSAIIYLFLALSQGPESVLMLTTKALEILPENSWLVLSGRDRRATSRIVPISQKEIDFATKFAEGVVDRMTRVEQNLMYGEITPQKGSSTYNAMLASWADNTALQIAKDSYVRNRASLYLANKHCLRYGLGPAVCAAMLTEQTKSCSTEESSCPPTVYRSYDGSCNNEQNPSWGETYSPFSRLLDPVYDDGFWDPRGSKRRIKDPQSVTEVMVKDTYQPASDLTLSLMGWATLVASDVAHTVSNRMINTGESVMCCTEDDSPLPPRHRHPFCMPVTRDYSGCVNYVRSMLAYEGDCKFGPGEQMNAATHYLDGSGIYGSSSDLVSSLRTYSGGLLKVEHTDDGQPNLPREMMLNCHHLNGSCYLAGDRRINVDVVGAVLHTILVREHNLLASNLSLLNPHWEDERLFQEARRILVAQIQHITYSEWLPLIIGKKEMQRVKIDLPATGYSQGIYNPKVKVGVANSFANAAMRFISSMVDGMLTLFSEERLPKKNILIRDAITNPELLHEEGMLDFLVRGLATQKCQPVDLSYSDAITRYMYSPANKTGMDGFALDIQRGRDHGLPGYLDYRKLFGLGTGNFDKLSDTIPKQSIGKLKKAYGKVSDIDLIVGGMAEAPQDGSLLGPVFTRIISKQLRDLRASDRFFYDNAEQPMPFSPDQLIEIRKASIARLLCDNGDNIELMQKKAFERIDPKKNKLVKCSDEQAIPKLNLDLWKES